MVKNLLAYPFRLFFLLAGLYGLVIILAWIFYLFGGLALPLGWSPVHWHSHEMLFGLIGAAIAGFILTAVCNWTGAAPLTGYKLLLLGLAWFLGRMAFWLAGLLPLWLVMLMDMLFLPALGAILMQILLTYKNKRNLPLGGMILGLTLANLLMHIGFINNNSHWLKQGEMLALNLITLIMLVIGGRIIPMFSANWLRQRGAKVTQVVNSNLDTVGLIATALLVPADLVGLPRLVGTLAVLAGVITAIRLWGWKGWYCWREPLLWILHLGYGWLVIALLLKGLAAFGLVNPSAPLHALGAGAMGTLVLGVMTRVALGHTGRALALPEFGWLMYAFISFAAICRVLAALGWINYHLGLMLAAAGWCFAFALFVTLYWSILSRPRLDGRPG